MKKKETQLIPQDQPTIPGIGVGGIIMCPYLKSPCLKSGCEMWVELSYGQNKVGRCSIAYQTIIGVELRREIELLRKVIAPPLVKKEG